MAALGAATTPAAAPAGPCGNNRHPRHRVAARRGRAVPARRLELRAGVSPAVTADAPDEAAAVSALRPSSLADAFRRASEEPIRAARSAATEYVFFLFPGTSGGSGTGTGDEAGQAGVPNLLLSPRERERSVRVSEVSVFRPASSYLPIVYRAASRFDGFFLSSDASSLECSTCKKVYPNKQDYWDLTVAVGSSEYSESMPAATELFR